MSPAGQGRRLVLATRNEHKLREMRAILEDFELIELPPEVELPPEDGLTFEANALIKARAAAEATGLPAIADDSGIAAGALQGRPGVRSARFAGEGAGDGENLDLLLRELAAQTDRSVAYLCAIAYVDEGGTERTFTGRCEGTFTDAPRGDRGFGYDPCFVPTETGPGDGRTMAELDDAEKHEISHRGKAARMLARHLESVR